MSRSIQRRRSNSAKSRRQEARRQAVRAAVGCAVESLEDRRLFSTLTVNTVADGNTADNTLSLREAIALIQNNGDATAALGRSLDGGESAQVDTTNPYGTNDTIVFDSSIAGQTITFGSTITASGTMTVDGGTAGMTLHGNNNFRAFYVTSTGDLTLDTLTITNFSNRGTDGSLANGGDGRGGAIYVDQGTLAITNSTLSNNSAVGGIGSNGNGGAGQGGAVYSNSGTVTITAGTLAGNSAAGGEGSNGFGASGQGGAVYSGSGDLTISNATLANNTAAGAYGSDGSGSGQGGAIYVAEGFSTLSYSTVSSNTATQGGRGCYVSSGGSATVQIDNSILGQADNTVTDLEFSGTVTASGSNNLIRNTAVTGIGNLSTADPKLGPLQDNGGPTQTMRPAADSPAIDAADDTLGGAPSTDQRGRTRPAGAYDVGAAEFAHVTLTVSTTADADTRDSDLSLREAMAFVDGTLSYADLTAGEQAWASGTIGDTYTITFDSSIAGGTIYLSSAVTASGTITIDGGTGGMTLSGAGGHRAFYVTSTGDLTLNKLTIDNFGFVGTLGNMTPGGDALGGAIYVDHGALTITNSTLSNNHVQGGYGLSAVGGNAKGGAIYVDYGSVTITNSTLSGNTATGGYGDVDMSNGTASGGAVYVSSGALTLTDSTLSDNTATGYGGLGNAANASGGAVYNASGTLTVAGSTTLQNNTASGRIATGGAISNDHGTFTLNVTAGSVTQNTATGSNTAAGGAIYSLLGTASLTFTNSTLSNNAAAGNATGGFADLEDADLSLVDCSVDHNTADGYGGAIMLLGGTLSVTGGTASYNSAAGTSTNEGRGGFLYNSNGTVTLTNATLSNNSVTSGTGNGNVRGGAIYAQGVSASVTIVGGVLDHNSAVAGGSLGIAAATGGAIYVNAGSLTITGSVLSDNFAVGSDSDYNAQAANGGAICGDTAIITITDSTLNGNSATGGNSSGDNCHGGNATGGAVYDSMGSITVTNSTLANNSVVGGAGDPRYTYTTGYARGGAIAADESDLTVDFSTLSSNTAESGRGVYFVSTTMNSHLQIDNSILGQADDSVADLDVRGGGYTESGSNNLIRNTAETGVGNLSSADPRLAPLGNYGGGVPTFALLPDSPALDAAGASGAVTLDVRGVARDYNGTSDIGSFESQGYTLTLDSGSTPQSAAAGQTFDNPLAVTLTENGFDAPIPGATITFTAPSSGSASATLAATATTDAGGDATVTATANNVVGSYTVIASFSATPGGPQDVAFALDNTGTAPTISSANSATFTAGSAGTFTITTAGAPLAALSTTGTLPSGVTFVDNGDGTATLAGTPAGLTGGAYTLTFTAGNGVGPDATQSFTLTVNPAPVSGVTGTAPTITSAATRSLVAGQAGTFTVTTTGSPTATLHVTGTLPDGITFVDNGDGTGTFSGTATDAGSYAVSVVADNGVGGPVTQALAITVNGVRPIIVASGYSGGPVSVKNADGTERFAIKPFKKGVGVRLASADFNGDGVPDVVAAAGTGGQPQVFVYDGVTGEKLASIMAFGKSFTGGLFVAAADVDHDGTPDVVVGQGVGGSSKVRVFSGKDQSLIADFNPLGNRAAGARVAAADLNGDGYAEVVVGQGFGNGAAVVRVFDGHTLAKHKAKKVATLSKAQLGFAGGVFVATGDVNGDGTADVIVSESEGKQPSVAVFNGTRLVGKNPKGALISRFQTNSDNGVRIASYDVDADGSDDIVTSMTVGDSSVVKIFSGADGSVLDTLENDQAGKVFVA